MTANTQGPMPNQKTGYPTWFGRLTRGLLLTTALTFGALNMGLADPGTPKKDKKHKKEMRVKTPQQRLDSVRKANPTQVNVWDQMAHDRALQDFERDTLATVRLGSPIMGQSIKELNLGSTPGLRLHPTKLKKVEKKNADGTITTNFVKQILPHKGTDLAYPNKTVIVAAHSGVLHSIKTTAAYGTIIELDGIIIPAKNGKGFDTIIPATAEALKNKTTDQHHIRTRYVHTTDAAYTQEDVKNKIVVTAGGAMARVGKHGSTGGTVSTGDHLHFEVLVDGVVQHTSYMLENNGRLDALDGEDAIDPDLEIHVRDALFKDRHGKGFHKLASAISKGIFGPPTTRQIQRQKMKRDKEKFESVKNAYILTFMKNGILSAPTDPVIAHNDRTFGPVRPTPHPLLQFTKLETTPRARVGVSTADFNVNEPFLDSVKIVAREEDIRVKAPIDLYHEEQDDLLPDPDKPKVPPLDPNADRINVRASAQAPDPTPDIPDASFYMPDRKLFGPTEAERMATREAEKQAMIKAAKEKAAAAAAAKIQTDIAGEIRVAPVISQADIDRDAFAKIAATYAPLTSQNATGDTTRFAQTEILGTQIPKMPMANAENMTAGFYMPYSGTFGANQADRIANDTPFLMLGAGKPTKKAKSTQTIIRGEYAPRDITERQRQNLINQKIRINGQEIVIDDNVIQAAQNAYGKNAAKDLHNRILNKVNGTERSALVQELHKMQRENANDVTGYVPRTAPRAAPGIAFRHA